MPERSSCTRGRVGERKPMAVAENVSSCSLSAMWDWSHLSLSGTPPAVPMLDAAADLLVLERKFAPSLELCERGLQILSAEAMDAKCEQVKTSLCTIGIQCLAELGRWREVLPWLMQYYQTPQEMPCNLMEMCILLYGKVKQPQVMLDVSSDWLQVQGNRLLPNCCRVAELHLLHILLPLGLFSDAEALAQESDVFTEKQQEVVLTVVNKHRRHWEEEEAAAISERNQHSQLETETMGQTGKVQRRILNVAHLLLRALGMVAGLIRRAPLRNIALAVLLISVILLRLDPASPAAYGPISSLILLLRQTIASIFQRQPDRQM
ncbi:peroxisomal biogenesis factor 26 L homeolog [Xenopus laevis]|uniref:Peroxisomal biogenesis factor 26 L homeolog n=1 Tax=Xenopus laevis TaxID=8355 RepID=Q6DEA5_XENLA|nr:peroxisomal biogenesis factor 26 L homeolog [Xenopus laevis]AAH77227.1 Pex26-prov protein [Xenopus laevis]